MNGLRLPHKRDFLRGQQGINMVDLMIWLVIAGMLASLAFQGLQPYRSAAIIYQMKNDVNGVVGIAAANGTFSGKIQDGEVEAAVELSQKSPGVTISWGKFALYAETPPPDTGTTPAALMGPQIMEPVSSVTPTGSVHENVAPGDVINTYVLVARHPDAPNIRVVYFFDDIHTYQRGVEVIGLDDLPPIEDMFGVAPDPDLMAAAAAAASAKATATPSDTPTPTPTNTAAAIVTPSDSPVATVAPTETITPSPTATVPAAATPTTTTAPVQSATPTPTPVVTQPPAASPSPSPTATTPPVDPTPVPDPITPAANKDPKTKTFLFCHDGMMHSNSYTGMINGHENHPADIMPPIPPINYPGHNWTYRTAQVYYNNCVPL